MVSGSNIRYYRLERKMTQEQLAEASDLSSNYISKIENGRKQIGIIGLERVAFALKVPISLLIQTPNYNQTNLQINTIVTELLDCTPHELNIISNTVLQSKQSLWANKSK